MWKADFKRLLRELGELLWYALIIIQLLGCLGCLNQIDSGWIGLHTTGRVPQVSQHAFSWFPGVYRENTTKTQPISAQFFLFSSMVAGQHLLVHTWIAFCGHVASFAPTEEDAS